MSAPAAFALLGLCFVVSFFIVRVSWPRSADKVLSSLSKAKKQPPMGAIADATFGLCAVSIAFGAFVWIERLLHIPAQWRWLVLTFVYASLWLSWRSIRNTIVAAIQKVSTTVESADPN